MADVDEMVQIEAELAEHRHELAVRLDGVRAGRIPRSPAEERWREATKAAIAALERRLDAAKHRDTSGGAGMPGRGEWLKEWL